MPPKVAEGPPMTVVTTDEEWAMVHGEDCSEAVKGFLHAVLCTRGRLLVALVTRVPQPAVSGPSAWPPLRRDARSLAR